MDVDLLRPGTVPISAETVLWFEFLLDPNLLLNHLKKPKPDPSGTELIMKFITSILDSIKNDIKPLKPEEQQINAENIIDIKPQDNLKNLALKILCLKIAAHMKWNLDILETKIPVKFQMILLQDLIYFTNNNLKVEIPNIPECNISEISDQYLFALIIYHRWLIRMTVQRGLNIRLPKQNGDIIIGTIEDFFLVTPELTMNSINFLTNVLSLNRTPKLLTYDTFVMLNEDTKEVQQSWESSTELNRYDFESQIYYDLGCYYFYREEYELAKQHFMKCSDCYYNLNPEQPLQYISFDLNYLHGFLYACNIPVEGFVPSLLQQMNSSIANQYTGILSILQEDNRIREIPVMYRTTLELDIQGALSSGKFTVARDLLLQVQMLNVVRYALDGETSHTGDFIHRLKYGGSKSIEILFWAVNSFLETCNNDNDRLTIKNFFMKLLMTEDIPELLEKLKTDDGLKNLLNKADFNNITLAQVRVDDVEIPDSLKNMDWMLPDFTTRRNPYLEAKAIEQKLLSTYFPQQIRELLVKLSATNPSKPIWRLTSSWEHAIPLQSVVKSMQRGFLQDFSYVLLAKSRELMNINNFEASIELLNILEVEVKNHTSVAQNIAIKLCKLINWEALLVQIAQLFVEWPANHLNKQAIAAKCQACLSVLETGDSVLPRLEVTEQCALCLLNLREWEYLCGLDKRWNYFEMAAAVAYACQDLDKYKGNKKISRDMWDLVLPIFGPSSSQTKRTSTGNTTVVHRDSPSITSKANLISFLSNLRDDTALNVVISMLARLYNVLKDESSLELVVEYIVLWPAVVSNANSYNIKGVNEILSQLVQQALKYYPNNISWLKLMGDINFGNSHYEVAIKYYLETLIFATDYFNQPPSKPLVDDHIFRRMIKCCTQINCHTQAAILCQFLDDIDYALAFKCLGENKSNNCYDAIDAYYNCIWDTTILEYLVNLHHKRDEINRKQKAVKAIGMFEINSNNNEEIQREAMNIRKSRFLRALTKQYLARDL